MITIFVQMFAMILYTGSDFTSDFVIRKTIIFLTNDPCFTAKAHGLGTK